MSSQLIFNEVERKILTIRNTKVILDSDVAALYGVETKRVNEAVRNNNDKFPHGYLLQLSKEEWEDLKSKISTSLGPGGKVKLPVAFTEKGLYMLATILKYPTIALHSQPTIFLSAIAINPSLQSTSPARALLTGRDNRCPDKYNLHPLHQSDIAWHWHHVQDYPPRIYQDNF